MTWDPSRRVFLKGAGLAAIGIGLGPSSLLTRAAYAAGVGDRVLVQVFLRGGADGLNMCVPHGDSNYYSLRPTIGLRLSNGVANLDGFFGLHPALSPLHELYNDGILALHPTIGNAQLTRSHFDAQDYMDTGTPGNKSTRDGWLDRVATQIPGAPLMQMVAFASRAPRAVLGAHRELVTQTLTGFTIRAGTGSTVWSTEAETLVRDAHAGANDPAYQSGRDVFDAIQTIRTTTALQAPPANGATYPAGSAGSGLRQAAQLIRAGLGARCIYINVPGGFDTHANQLAGNNADYPLLAAALVAFRRDLGALMDNVLVMVTTEFGRTAAQNGTAGTDHGFAHCGIFLGGGVRGGRVHGVWPGLARTSLNEGRDLRYTVDFRDVFLAAARWIGVTDSNAVIPGYLPGPDPGLFA